MALAKLTEAAHKELPEALQAEYTRQDDGSYLLKVESVDGLVLENVDGLKTALSKTRGENGTLKKQVQEYGDIDPATAKANAKLAGELGDMSVDDKIKAATAQREKDLIAAHEEEKKKLSDQNSSYASELDKLLLDGEIASALEDHGGDKVVLPAFIRGMVKRVRDDSGNSKAVVLDAAGNERIGDGQGNPMTISQLVKSLSDDEKYAPYFEGTGASGTGASGEKGTGNKKPATNPATGKMEIPADDQAAIDANVDKIASGEAVVVEPAEA